MSEIKFNAEHLRPVLHATEPDPRSTSFVRFDHELREMRPLRLEDHHAAVCDLVLHAGVPEEVTIHFETAKNLYLYAWYVYRFFAVAEHQSLACLEMALRLRLGEEVRAKRAGKRGPVGLTALLKYSTEVGLVRNEGFKRWHDQVWRRARNRYVEGKSAEIAAKGLTSIVLDDAEVEIGNEDRTFDYVKTVTEVLPKIRNMYAHGSPSIHNQVRGTLELCMEIINQVFAKT
jgi:hypothetical protein